MKAYNPTNIHIKTETLLREKVRASSLSRMITYFLGKPTVVSKKLLLKEGRGDEAYLCQYSQIGNAVPPLLAKAIAENIIKQLK